MFAVCDLQNQDFCVYVRRYIEFSKDDKAQAYPAMVA